MKEELSKTPEITGEDSEKPKIKEYERLRLEEAMAKLAEIKAEIDFQKAQLAAAKAMDAVIEGKVDMSIKDPEERRNKALLSFNHNKDYYEKENKIAELLHQAKKDLHEIHKEESEYYEIRRNRYNWSLYSTGS